MQISFKRCYGLVIAITGITFASGQNTVYDVRAKPIEARVNVMALSTSIHRAIGEDEDIYLGEVFFKSNQTQVAKLVDRYQGRAIRQALLEGQSMLTMRLTRSAECDSTGAGFFLGPQSKLFSPDASKYLREHPADKISCFIVDHAATRLAKG